MNHYTCKHFTGTQNKTCAAGIAYDSVTIDPDKPGSAYRKPCINWVEREKSLPTHRQRPLSQNELAESCGKCDKHELPTAEEVAKWKTETNAWVEKNIRRTMLAREAILDDLRRRWKEGPTPEHGITCPSDISRFCKPQKNYFCGAGKMKCPVCHEGELQYSRGSYNGHVHARCSTKDCVAWME